MGKSDKISDEDLSMLEREKRSEVKRLLKLLNSATSKGNLSEQSKLCNALGEMFATSGLQQLALRYHTQDLEISELTGKPYDIGVAHRKVGEMFSELGEFQEAVAHQEKYLQITEDLGDLVEQQRAHATLGRTFYTQLMSESVPETAPDGGTLQDLRNKAGRHYINALKLTKTLRSQRLSSEKELVQMTARLHLNIGLLYEKWNSELSVNYLKKALTESQLHRDTTIQHLALMQLVEASLASHDIAQATLYAEQAVKVSKSVESEFAKSNEMLALVQIHSKNFLEARRCSKLALQTDSDLETAMTIYKLTKLVMSTQQIDFGETEREVGILSKITVILMKLFLHNQSLSWLAKELKLAKQCHASPETVADLHGKLGESCQATGDSKLAIYHYTQQLNLVSSPGTWNNIALVYLADNQPYQACYDSIQAGIGEAQTSQDKALCLTTLVKIARQFDVQDVLQSAQEELSRIEDSYEGTYSHDPDPVSDVEISESESENVDGESETKPVKRGKLGRVNEKGETPLHQACIEGKAEKVRELLCKHASPNSRDHAGWTPLHEACNHGYLEIVELLVSAGADINDRGGRECGGITPLHDAAQWGNLSIVKYLVQNGANTLAKDDEARTALQLAQNILKDDPCDVNSENRKNIREYLEEVSKKPPPQTLARPHRQTKLNTETVFTSGATDHETHQSRPDDKPPTLASVWRSGGPTSSNYSGKENRRQRENVVEKLCKPIKQRCSDPTRQKSSKLGKQRISEPSRSRSSLDKTDPWLDTSSPKRKKPDHDTHKVHEMKRPKQTVLPNPHPVPLVVKHPTAVPQVASYVAPQPAVIMLKLRVKIKIRDTLFLVPVKSQQTIRDLAAEAAQRYRTKLGILPKISLTTMDGAELTGEDVAAELLVDGDELVGVVEEDDHVGLQLKYQETCARLGVEDVLKEVFDGSGTSICLTRSLASHQQLECLFTTILSCATLTKLDISFNRLSKEVCTTFCSVLPTLSSLSDINISGCGVSNANFLKVSDSLSGLPLESLLLDFNGISHCLAALLELVVLLPSLATLSAKCCTLTSAEILPELSEKFRHSSLSSLDFSQNHILDHPPFPKKLKSLSIGGASIEDTNLQFPVTLETLCLENCSLNDTNFKDFLSNLPNIRTFKCPHNHITGESVLDLIRLFPNLSVLDLSSNPLGPSGIETLTLAPPPTVVLQNCKGAGITAEVVTALHAVVESCDLSFNKINYQGFCNILSQDVRDAVTCQGNKLIINGVGS